MPGAARFILGHRGQKAVIVLLACCRTQKDRLLFVAGTHHLLLSMCGHYRGDGSYLIVFLNVASILFTTVQYIYPAIQQFCSGVAKMPLPRDGPTHLTQPTEHEQPPQPRKHVQQRTPKPSIFLSLSYISTTEGQPQCCL